MVRDWYRSLSPALQVLIALFALVGYSAVVSLSVYWVLSQ